MRYSDEIKLSMSVDFKVNLGNYESASVFVCLSGVPIGATEEDIEYAMDTAGLAWEVIRDKVRAQAEGLKQPDKPAPMSEVARQSRPAAAAVETHAYNDEAKRELSAWARGIGMDRYGWTLIESKRGAGSWHALFKAREVGCKTARQLMEYCIDGLNPSSVDAYDPFKDDEPGKSTSAPSAASTEQAAEPAAAGGEAEAQVLKVFRLSTSELRKVQAAAKRMKVDLVEVANKTSNKEFAALMTSIDPDWKLTLRPRDDSALLAKPSPHWVMSSSDSSEEWIEDTVQRLPYFDDGSAQAVAAISEKPVEGGEYDPFADE